MSSRIHSVRAHRDDSYVVISRRGLLSVDDPTLADQIRPGGATLVVTTPSVENLYGNAIRRYLAANCSGADLAFTTLACSEADKSIEQVLWVCQHAARAGLARRSQIICVGGGVALDVCGLAATLFRRGIGYIRVPTTLIGMIDAGIGVKNGVNFDDSKSLLGSFSPCEACLVDASFLRTLPVRHLRCGLAESIKIATMCSPELFELLEDLIEGLRTDCAAAHPERIDKLIQLSIEWTIRELELNLFEREVLFCDGYARKLDFGHTFSPYLESASSYELLHGEAVAIDMAISSELARRFGLLATAECGRLLQLIARAGLPISWARADSTAMHRSLQSVARHRNGRLNLPLPTSIGKVAYFDDLDELGVSLIAEVLQTLLKAGAATGVAVSD